MEMYKNNRKLYKGPKEPLKLSKKGININM